MELLSLKDLFNKGMFQIPNYQRGYSWQTEQVTDFLEDLEQSAKNKVKEYFTGTITVIPNGEKLIGMNPFNIFNVVDGQQRLTTFSIFIYAVCKRLQALKMDSETVSEILNIISYRGTPTLLLNNNTSEFYQKYIIDKDIKDLPTHFENKAQENLANAKKIIYKHLESKKITDIEPLFICFTKVLKISFLTLNNNSEAGIIFETMNSRGLALTPMDLVKNYLVYLASSLQDKTQAEIQAKAINDQFGCIFGQFMKANLTLTNETEFLKFAYIVYKGEASNEQYHTIKDFLSKTDVLEKPTETMQELLKYIAFLESSSTIYAKIRSLDFKNLQIREIVQKILYLDKMTNIYPLLIALFERYDETSLLDVLKAIEVFVFRVYKIGNRQSNAAQNALWQLAHSMFKREANCRDLIYLLENNKFVGNYDFEESLKSASFYSDQSANTIKYIFYEYEIFLNTNKKTNFKRLTIEELNSTKIQIEHIEPQNPVDGKNIPGLHKLGNLVLTYNNTALGIKNFSEKKLIYKFSNFLAEIELVEHEKWDEASIKNRTKQLIDFCKQRWHLDLFKIF